MGSCCKRICWSVPCQTMLHDDGHHETDNPPACRGRYIEYTLWIYCLQQEKKVNQKETFLLLLQPGVSKDKIDRKLPSVYGKNINKKKNRPQKEIRTVDGLITPSASPFSRERVSTPGPINHPSLSAHKKAPYQLTRFGSSLPRCSGWLESHREETNLIFHWKYTGAVVTVSRWCLWWLQDPSLCMKKSPIWLKLISGARTCLLVSLLLQLGSYVLSMANVRVADVHE